MSWFFDTHKDKPVITTTTTGSVIVKFECGCEHAIHPIGNGGECLLLCDKHYNDFVEHDRELFETECCKGTLKHK